MSTHPIGLGVIGAHATRGWARATHLPALTGSPDFAVRAVAGTSAEAAREAATAWGADRSYDSVAALLADPEVEAVLIAVQLTRREGLIEAAIAAGKHVYSEWPLALSAEAATAMKDAAEAVGVRHAVGLQTRHHAAARRMRALIAEGAVGEVLSASLHYSRSSGEVWPERYTALFDVSKGVNHLAIIGGHSMDLFASVVGGFAELSATLTTAVGEVTVAETGEPLKVTSPDQILAQGLLEDGTPASVHITVGGPTGGGYRLEVQGRAGRLVLSSATGDDLVGPALALTLDTGDGPSPVDAGAHGGAAAQVADVYREFATSIRGGESTGPDFATAARTHATIDAIKESAATGRRVTVRR